MKDFPAKYTGSKWKGKGELWLDPEGNIVIVYDCTLNIENGAINYSWVHENKTKNGCLTFDDNSIAWVDTWHQETPVQCSIIPNAWGIFTVSYEYEVPDSLNWGWRIKLSERPGDSLVLQMTNIAPWGEEGRAVRMVFNREQV